LRTLPQESFGPGVARWSACALAVGIPLLFDPAGFETYLPLKWMLTCALVPAGVAAAVWTKRATKPNQWRVWMVAWGGFLTVLSLATVLSAEPLVSLIGAPQRNLGLVAWVLFGLAGWLGFAISSNDDSERLLRAFVWASIPVAAYGLLQVMGADPLHYAPGLDVARARSTFGNAAFLGAYLVLVIPIAADRVLNDEGTERIVSGVAVALAGAALLATQTRGAWVGGIVALTIYAIGRRREIVDFGRPMLVGAAMVIVVIGITMVVTPLGSRAASAFNFGRGTVHGRLVQWSDTVDLVARRPVLGWGPDTYGAVFPRVMSDRFARVAGEQLVADRAQNGILDVTSSAGVLGLAGWVAIIGVVLAAGWRRRNETWVLAVTAAIVGYLVQLQFGFPLADVDVLFWLLAGLVVAGASTPRPETTGRRVATAALVAVAIAGLVWSGREVVADRHLRTAVSAERRNQLPTAYGDYRAAARTASERVVFRQALVRFLDRVGSSGQAKGALSEALTNANMAQRLAPQDPQQSLDRADVLLSMAEEDRQPDSMARAERAYRAVLRNYKASARAEQSLGVVLADEGNLAGAEQAWRRAAYLAPKAAGPLVDLGLLHMQQGRQSEARTELQQALRLEPGNKQATEALAKLGSVASP
jgi:O-antigen ligase/regulator of sirC expression with transglutaminase-like and TPR domain